MSAEYVRMSTIAAISIAVSLVQGASAQEAVAQPVQQEAVQLQTLPAVLNYQGPYYDDVAIPAAVADTPENEYVPEDPVALDTQPTAEEAQAIEAAAAATVPLSDAVVAQAGVVDGTTVAQAAVPDAAVAQTAAVDETAVAIARAQEEVRQEAAAQERAAAEAKAEEAIDRRRMHTRIFRLAHANAEEVAERFNSIWSGEFGTTWRISRIATSFPEANAVMITAPKRILESCEQVLAEIDREAQQVYIEARFVELGNIASHKLGIDWSMLSGMTGSASFGGGLQSTRVGSGVENYTRQITTKTDFNSYSVSGQSGQHDGDVSYFNGTLTFSEMSLTLRALESSEDAKVFSNPKIIVSSGKKATVDMTTKYPSVLVSAKRTLNGNAESLDIATQMVAIPGEDKFMFAREAFFSWGIQLDVVPRIGTNGLINVTIVPTISDIDTTYGTGGFVMVEGDSSESGYSAKYPIIKVQRLVTEFNMASGTTAVIGGLSRTVESQVDSGIPWLRSLPWIGPKLFGSKVRVKEQREIIVFVTVGLVDPKAMHQDAGLPKNAVLGRQYVNEQKLEPGDRPQKNMEGIESLDMRPLEEQAKDPLKRTKKSSSYFDLKNYMPFRRDSGNSVKGAEAKPSSEEGDPKTH